MYNLGIDNLGAEFCNFLKAYSVEDYGKINSSISSSQIIAIFNKHQSKFDLWLKVPERLRDEYGNRVPDEVLNETYYHTNLTMDDLKNRESNHDIMSTIENICGENQEAKKFISDRVNAYKGTKEYTKNVEFIHSKGYSDQHSNNIALINESLKALEEAYKSGLISDEDYKIAKQNLRKLKCDVMKDDYNKNRPEVQFLHAIKNLKQEEFKEIITLYVLAQKIKEMGREEDLVKYMQSSASGYNNWSEEKKQAFSKFLKLADIDIPDKIEKNNNSNLPLVSPQAEKELQEQIRMYNLVSIELKLGLISEERAKKIKEEIQKQANEILIKDWQKNYPERLLVHLFNGEQPKVKFYNNGEGGNPPSLGDESYSVDGKPHNFGAGKGVTPPPPNYGDIPHSTTASEPKADTKDTTKGTAEPKADTKDTTKGTAEPKADTKDTTKGTAEPKADTKDDRSYGLVQDKGGKAIDTPAPKQDNPVSIVISFEPTQTDTSVSISSKIEVLSELDQLMKKIKEMRREEDLKKAFSERTNPANMSLGKQALYTAMCQKYGIEDTEHAVDINEGIVQMITQTKQRVQTSKSTTQATPTERQTTKTEKQPTTQTTNRSSKTRETY